MKPEGACEASVDVDGTWPLILLCRKPGRFYTRPEWLYEVVLCEEHKHLAEDES